MTAQQPWLMRQPRHTPLALPITSHCKCCHFIFSKSVKWHHWLNMLLGWNANDAEPFLPGASASSLEERNHSDQGAQRDEQDAEGRGGAGVAQIRVAAAKAALLQGITLLLGSIAHVLVRAATMDWSLVRHREISLNAPIEQGGVTISFCSFAVATIDTIVAFDRQHWNTKCKVHQSIPEKTTGPISASKNRNYGRPMPVRLVI